MARPAERLRSEGGAAPSGGFAALDDALIAGTALGVVGVSVPDAMAARSLAAHFKRRASGLRRPVVTGASAPIESAWRDVSQRLGLELDGEEPSEAARVIVRKLRADGALLILLLLAPSAWDLAVTRAIVEEAPELEAMLVTLEARAGQLGVARWFSVGAELGPSDLGRFWLAATAELCAERGASLSEAEARYRAAQSLLRGAEHGPDRVALARPMARRLACSRRAWPLTSLPSLGIDERELDELLSLGLVEVADGRAAALFEVPSVGAEEASAVAAALVACFPSDPWAHARAAELLSAIDAPERAEQAMRRALCLARDVSLRPELWRRWSALLDERDEAEPARLRAAELALQLGDVEIAASFAEQAARGTEPARAALALGRAALARGDLVTAEAALGRSRALADGAPARLEAMAELAEVRYSRGELAESEALARAVLAEGPVARSRLAARNLIGKVKLARAEWSAAEAHFAADAVEAALEGDVVSELRARVNRAIALLSAGSHDEARPILDQVLIDAEARGELRASGFALSNLAVLAMERHEYARSLDCSERAIAVRRRIGDRLGFARDVVNLVELRLRLGMVEAAEQALRFGRQALGPGAPASRLAEVALVSARVHLARGHQLDADRELRAALRTAAQASDGDKLGECHRFAVRLALDEGAVARAVTEIEAARALADTSYATGEVALLDALLARASGREAAHLAAEAVRACRESGDEELLREAHVLAAEVHLADDELASAASHVGSAVALRDEIARALGPEHQAAYLARPELRRLALLERAEIAVPSDVEPVSIAPARRPSDADGARFVGRHPAVRALLASVQRVGRSAGTVLVHGESGTGKELVAEAVHAASERAAGPLVKVNCAALVEALLLSELFGHEKGAFTGAAARRRGRFERAHGGTLFLDEIGDISPRTQVALLRVLEERKIERVGGSAAIPVDVRIVCATHRDLRAMVERGEFREDLYYRLSGIVLEVPPLRERLSDLGALVESILLRVGRERGEAAKDVDAAGLELLARHRWPGNVRELENALRAASLFADGPSLGPEALREHVEALRKIAAEANEPRVSLPQPAGGPPPQDVASAAYGEIRGGRATLGDLKRAIERDCIARALQETGGNITRAALLLGMKRPRLSQLVKQHELLANEDDGE
jgi:DNA-binding NtrC family response regulator/tetratricopeptide (TPR) repeat protein